MSIAWRLVQKIALKNAFSGVGALIYGGRWNPKGVPVVYMSESLALASLELLVRLSKQEKDHAFLAIPVLIPGDVSVEALDIKKMPKGWRDCKTPLVTQEIGNRWVKEGRSAVLKVPSVIVPSEYNLVVNPRHADFTKIKPGPPQSFSFDPRLWK